MDFLLRRPWHPRVHHSKGARMMMLVIAGINLTALVIIIRKGLPRPFPWLAAGVLGLVLLIGALASPNGSLNRGVGFVTLLSSVIVTAHLAASSSMAMLQHSRSWLWTIVTALTAIIIVDAFGLFPTPDVAMTSGETFGFIRRPYMLEHPNVQACWLLLLSLSPISLIGIIFTQSRGALLGYLAAFVRFAPKRFYMHALIAGTIIITAAALIRPHTFFGRVDLWRDAVRIFIEHPLTGSGTGSYTASTVTGMDTAHNAALTIAAENGLIGIAAFLAWLVALVLLIARSTSAAKFHLLAFSIQQLVDDQWLHPVTAILLGAVIGICIRWQGENG
jgi:hypothetical protein